MQWLDSVKQLAQDQLTYQDDFAAAQQAHQAFTPAAKRLEVANKALELESQFQALSHSRESVKQLNTERQGLLDQIPEQQSKRQQTKAALERCERTRQPSRKQPTNHLANYRQDSRIRC